MKSKLKWFIPGIILVALLIFYIIPTPNEPFESLAGEVPETQLLLYQGFQGFKAQRMVIDNTSWEFISVGPPNAETVLFLHGMTGAYDSWWHQIVLMRTDFHLISVTIPPVSSLAELSQGVLRIMDSQNIQQTNLVGTSMGGYLAQFLVANHPERFTRVVLSNTFPPNDAIQQDNAIIGAALPFLPEWFIMRNLRTSLTQNVIPAAGGDPFTRAYLLSMVSGRMTKADVNARYKVMIESFTPIEPLSANIAVMIIESDNDPLIDETLRQQLKETYPLSFVVTFQGAGHLPYLNRPEEYTNQLVKFFLLPIME